ncbi:hypothetical protein P7C71_g5667, partial [Lecanoromycetidae sp. Uapishka_2]
MSSPHRPKGSPARRAALHERSDSQTNERASPTLRMVGDPQAPIYGSNPFPTKPSQILSPKGYNTVQGSTAGAEFGVSPGQNPPGETKGIIEDSSNVATVQFHKERPNSEEYQHVPSPQRSSTTASFHTPQAHTPTHATTSLISLDQAPADTGRVSDDIVQLPSVPPKPEAAGPFPISHLHETRAGQPIPSKESDSSLSSSNSTGTVIVKKNKNGKRASYSAFPSTRPSSSKSNLSLSTPQRLAIREQIEEPSPVSPVSPITPNPLSFSTPAERRTPSAPAYGNPQEAGQSSPNLQYPVIRPPAASASWAESPIAQPQRMQRTLERAQERWNPHLSTVQSVRSEGTGSHSDERASQTMWLPDSSRVSKSSSSMAMNARGSSDLPPVPSPAPARGSSVASPLPYPPPIHQRDITGSSTIRVVSERDDELSNLPPPIPGSRGSELLGVPPEDNRASVVTKRGSRASFFRDSIPAWAKAYYARPTSSTWFIASFCPLPPRPAILTAKGKDRQTQIAENLEKQLGPIDEARYENARWWRNINRILSLIGILIIATVIALAVVAAK